MVKMMLFPVRCYALVRPSATRAAQETQPQGQFYSAADRKYRNILSPHGALEALRGRWCHYAAFTGSSM